MLVINTKWGQKKIDEGFIEKLPDKDYRLLAFDYPEEIDLLLKIKNAIVDGYKISPEEVLKKILEKMERLGMEV